MPRFCISCTPNTAICDFCRFVEHNNTLDHNDEAYCAKHQRTVDLADGCDDFECFRGAELGWADEQPKEKANA